MHSLISKELLEWHTAVAMNIDSIRRVPCIKTCSLNKISTKFAFTIFFKQCTALQHCTALHCTSIVKILLQCIFSFLSTTFLVSLQDYFFPFVMTWDAMRQTWGSMRSTWDCLRLTWDCLRQT